MSRRLSRNVLSLPHEIEVDRSCYVRLFRVILYLVSVGHPSNMAAKLEHALSLMRLTRLFLVILYYEVRCPTLTYFEHLRPGDGQ